MHLSPPPSLQYREAYVIGDVQVDELAVIAPGVLLYAEQGNSIRIGSGVCIGVGSVIHAHGGDIEIAAGANLGKGVLIWGQGKIGQDACVGANSSLINPNLAPATVISPTSLVGDASRQVTLTATVTVEKTVTEKTSVAVMAEVTVPLEEFEESPPAPVSTVESPVENISVSTPKPPVVGKDYLQQMMGKMFPGRAGLHSNGDSPPNGTGESG